MRRSLALVALALALRGLAAWLAPVSDDLHGWRRVAEVLAGGGNPYAETSRLNWPPLWMLWLGAAGAAADTSGLPFDLLVRLLPFAADAGIVLVLYRLAPRAALVYALHPVALTTTGAQAQFDALAALATLLATALVAHERPGRDGGAGLLLGLGAGFKTWPLLLAPALAARLGSWAARARLLLLAGLLPAILLVPLWLTAPQALERHVLAYRSQPGWWGLTSLGILFPAPVWRQLGQFAFEHGSLLLLAALALAWWRGARLPAFEGTHLGLLAFLVVTAGFGPQYLLWSLPFACLARGRLALAWHVATGAALLAEFFWLPQLAADPALTPAAAAIAGNRLINQLRFPAWIASVAWFGALLWQSRTPRRD